MNCQINSLCVRAASSALPAHLSLARLAFKSLHPHRLHGALLSLNAQTAITNTDQASCSFRAPEWTCRTHRAEQGLPRARVMAVLHWSESSGGKATQLKPGAALSVFSTTGIQTALGKTLLISQAKGLRPKQGQDQTGRPMH